MSASPIAPGAETAPEAPPSAPSVPGDVTATPSASPAQSIAAGGQAAHGPTQLTLKTVVGSAAPKTVTLQCDPVGGTHPKAAQACADLAKARGDDFTLASDGKNPRACFMIYSPVTTTAEGQLRGEAVKHTARFPNTCVMRTQTGSIFDF
ncbi:hypothetical protein GCM10023196_073430 [Actinoallomurus vinaceus]|uniref:Subtilisin inhibitor domain-containing protein n=2 Tax=Actinoallomurus vinaceus TaxID=1080074 RepID=A0ABP8UM97_9ACTN